MDDARHVFKHLPTAPGKRPKRGISDESSYRAVQVEFMRTRDIPIVPYDDDTPRWAIVDHDKLAFECVCGNGVPVLPPQFGACVSCGRLFRDVIVPSASDLADADAVLRLRPVKNRNWDPTRETIEDLERENGERGLPVPVRDRRYQVRSPARARCRWNSYSPIIRRVAPPAGIVVSPDRSRNRFFGHAPSLPRR